VYNSDWNLEQMQRDIEQSCNGLVEGSVSTNSSLYEDVHCSVDEELDYDSDKTLSPVSCDHGYTCSIPAILKYEP
jgi:hypothetical protein